MLQRRIFWVLHAQMSPHRCDDTKIPRIISHLHLRSLRCADSWDA